MSWWKNILDVHPNESYEDSVKRRTNTMAFSQDGESYKDGVKRRLDGLTDTREGESYTDGVMRRAKSLFLPNEAAKSTGGVDGFTGAASAPRVAKEVPKDAPNFFNLKFGAYPQYKKQTEKKLATPETPSVLLPEKEKKAAPPIAPTGTPAAIPAAPKNNWLELLKAAQQSDAATKAKLLSEYKDSMNKFQSQRNEIANSKFEAPKDDSWLGKNKNWLAPLVGIGGMLAANKMGGGNAAAGFGQGWQRGIDKANRQQANDIERQRNQFNKDRATKLNQLDSSQRGQNNLFNKQFGSVDSFDDQAKLAQLGMQGNALGLKQLEALNNSQGDAISDQISAALLAGSVTGDGGATLSATDVKAITPLLRDRLGTLAANGVNISPTEFISKLNKMKGKHWYTLGDGGNMLETLDAVYNSYLRNK